METTRKRILWLFNHTSLTQFQVPLFLEMGYEVFCPKIYSFECGDNSASITYKYDSSLSLPAEVLEEFNHIDFYQPFSLHTMELINKYFDIAFVMLINEHISPMIKTFHGPVVLLAFGLDKTMSYHNVLLMIAGQGLLKTIRDASSRFWFGIGYKNIAEIESEMFQQRALYLPTGMKDANVLNKWEGGDKRFLFINAKIRTSSYYTNTYKKFKKDFGDLPHAIGGSQLIPVENDPSVMGFLPREQYDYNMMHFCAMYYHSQEPRHLHYHPLEAVKLGMPLVFMAGSMLDNLGGDKLPGRCESVQEARQKLKRLAKGDKDLIERITSSQGILLEHFTEAFCKPYWEKGMLTIENSIEQNPTKKLRKKVAFVMPAVYTGGVLDFTIRFVLAVKKEIDARGDNTEILLAYPDDKLYEKQDYFKAVRKAGIPLRPFYVEIRKGEWVENSLKLAGMESPQNCQPATHPEVYGVMKDGIADFQDCDHLIFTTDCPPQALKLFSLLPYTVVVHDCIQRYVPAVTNSLTQSLKHVFQQNASHVIVTSEPTYEDAIQYSLIRKNKIHLMPLLLDLPIVKTRNIKKGKKTYFVWSTNASQHKNHLIALQAISTYYRNGGTLDCIITGANSNYLDPKQNLDETSPVQIFYVKRVREMIRQDKLLNKHIKFYGELPKLSYYDTLANAQFLFHPGYADNGSATVVDAAGVGVPSLSSDYPGMRYLSDYTKIPLQYTDPFDADAMSESLLDMETHIAKYIEELPDREILEQATYINQSPKVYEQFRQIVEL